MDGGVGVTALLVAAARAIETHRHDSLAQDPYAEHFVRTAPASTDWPVRIEQVPDGDADPLWGRFARYFGLRTRIYDEFLQQAVRAGARQVVLLEPDSTPGRSARLAARLRDLRDRPGRRAGVQAQGAHGLAATPKATRVPIPIDLRDDWVRALMEAGFDAAAPSAWLAEGLLFYLPAPAETQLIDSIDRLSATEALSHSKRSSRRT